MDTLVGSPPVAGTVNISAALRCPVKAEVENTNRPSAVQSVN